VFIFDLKPSSEDYAYADSFFDITLDLILVDLAGFEPASSSVRLMREGQSATSAAYVRWFYPRKIRKNGAKTVKPSIFYHARQPWLQMVANGCKWHEEGNAYPSLS